ncbi:cupin domain-containing protein [Streptomyces sp. NPDC096033]|uniref:cupin domain-containing protein n=1 Tax=Streptomyces sp. NPDC096033 TaxID=3366071 RepID=UPI0038062607
MNPTTPIAVDLFASALHFHPDGDVRAAERRTVNSDSGSWQLAAFHAETDADVHADHWEMHPEADEAVCCLTGGARIHFRPAKPEGAADPDDLVQLKPGTAVIVPRGRWHRVELDAPSDLMSITLPNGTRHEKRTETR